MKKILIIKKLLIFLIIFLNFLAFKVYALKSIDTYKINSILLSKPGSILKKESNNNYTIINNTGGYITVNVPKNFRCSFNNSSFYQDENSCTIYTLNEEDLIVKIYNKSEVDYNNPKNYKSYKLFVKNEDINDSNLNILSIKDDNGKILDVTNNYTYNYSLNNKASLNIQTPKNSKCKISKIGVNSGIKNNNNVCKIEKDFIQAGKYKIEVSYKNTIKYYFLNILKDENYNTEIKDIILDDNNYLQKVNENEYNLIISSGEIKVKVNENATCSFDASDLKSYTNDYYNSCGLYSDSFKQKKYILTVKSGQYSKDYIINILNNYSNLKDLSIKNFNINNDENLLNENENYTVNHKGNLYFEIILNNINTQCEIIDYYDNIVGIKNNNSCNLNENNKFMGNYRLKVFDNDSIKFYKINYKLSEIEKNKYNIKKIDVNKNKLILNKGSDFNLITIVLPGNAINKEVYYISSDSQVANVTDDGKVQGITPGQTTISIISKVDSSIIKNIDVKVNDNLYININKNSNYDINCDGIVNIVDVAIVKKLSENTNDKSLKKYINNCDINNDGGIDINDINEVIKNIGKSMKGKCLNEN